MVASEDILDKTIYFSHLKCAPTKVILRAKFTKYFEHHVFLLPNKIMSFYKTTISILCIDTYITVKHFAPLVVTRFHHPH